MLYLGPGPDGWGRAPDGRATLDYAPSPSTDRFSRSYVSSTCREKASPSLEQALFAMRSQSRQTKTLTLGFWGGGGRPPWPHTDRAINTRSMAHLQQVKRNSSPPPPPFLFLIILPPPPPIISIFVCCVESGGHRPQRPREQGNLGRTSEPLDRRPACFFSPRYVSRPDEWMGVRA